MWLHNSATDATDEAVDKTSTEDDDDIDEDVNDTATE